MTGCRRLERLKLYLKLRSYFVIRTTIDIMWCIVILPWPAWSPCPAWSPWSPCPEWSPWPEWSWPGASVVAANIWWSSCPILEWSKMWKKRQIGLDKHVFRYLIHTVSAVIHYFKFDNLLLSVQSWSESNQRKICFIDYWKVLKLFLDIISMWKFWKIDQRFWMSQINSTVRQ